MEKKAAFGGVGIRIGTAFVRRSDLIGLQMRPFEGCRRWIETQQIAPQNEAEFT